MADEFCEENADGELVSKDTGKLEAVEEEEEGNEKSGEYSNWPQVVVDVYLNNN